jgi:anthranilate/para-aminobenzoate synthase component I
MALLQAGAGIVHGSVADQEFEETEIKFQPMLAALNGSPKDVENAKVRETAANCER